MGDLTRVKFGSGDFYKVVRENPTVYFDKFDIYTLHLLILPTLFLKLIDDKFQDKSEFILNNYLSDKKINQILDILN